MIKLLTVFSLLAIAIFVLSFTYNVNPGAWERLGSRKVDFKLDKDVVVVTAKRGGFTKLKLKVTGGRLNMHKMVVVYGNGSRDEIKLRHNFTRKSGSRIIDLKGGKRIIKKIIFWYDTKNIANKRAALHVFGRH